MRADPPLETAPLTRRFTVPALAAVIGSVVWAVVLFGICALALLGGSYTDVVIAHGPGECSWYAHLPGDDPHGDPSCVQAVGGVPLGPVTLVKEPGYLENGQAFSAWRTEQAALFQALHGQPSAGVEAVRPGEAARVVPLPLRGLALGDLTVSRVALLLTALVTVAIGSFAFWKRPTQTSSRSLLVLTQGVYACQLISLANEMRGLAFPPWALLTLYLLNMAGMLVAAGGILFTAVTFPVPRLGRRTADVLLTGLPVLGGLAFAAEALGAFGAAVVVSGVLVLVALVFIVASPWLAGSQRQRLQARWVLWGLAFPVVLWLISRSSVLMGGGGASDPTDTLLAIAIIAFPAGIATAILRERLFNIDVVIRRTVLGAVVTLLVLFVYNVLISSLAGSMADVSASRSWFQGVFISALVLTFTLLPAQAGLEVALDRVFFRNRYHWRNVLARLPDTLAMLNSPDDAARTVVDQLAHAMESRRVVVALAPEDGHVRRWVTGDVRGDQDTGIVLIPPSNPAFWSDLESLGDLYFLAPDTLGRPVNQWMRTGGLELLVPLRTPEALVGMLACALPRGRKVLSSEDLSVLRTVAASLAMALSRSLAYETIRRMNAELEERVAQRTEELARARLQLFQWEKMASIGVLAAGVAHELNTPLGVVVSTSEQLSRSLAAPAGGSTPDRTARLVKLCLEAANRAVAIVKDLRAFSRPESKAVEWVDLAEVVHSTVRLLGPTLRARSVELKLEMGEIPSIEGYPALLNQTLANLILNAVHAIKQDGWIRLSVARQGTDRVRVEVEDSGPGIPPEIRTRIFEPFFTTKAPGDGTGLGLSLCFTFVDQHGGRIWEDGEAGHGARFVIELPIQSPVRARAEQLRKERGAGDR